MQIAPTTQIYQNNYTKISDTNNKKQNIDINGDTIIDLSNKFPKNIVNAIDKIAEDTNMNQVDRLLFATDLQMSMSDYHAGKEIHPNTMVGDGFDGKPMHTDHIITKKEMQSIDFDDFLSKALSSFTQGLHTTGGEVKERYEELVNNYSLLQQNYNQVKSEPIYA